MPRSALGLVALWLSPLAACDGPSPSTPPAGYDLPALTGRVVDRADLLPVTDEATITGQLAALEQATGHQLVVVTVPGLGGHTIEDYTQALGNRWGVGRKTHNDGVVLLVAPAERKVRIAVGRGLETTLRDDEANRIIRQAILPVFGKGDMAAGIHAGVDRLIEDLKPQRTRA